MDTSQAGLEDSGHEMQKAVGAHVLLRGADVNLMANSGYEEEHPYPQLHVEGGRQGFSISNCQTWASIQDENGIFTMPAATH